MSVNPATVSYPALRSRTLDTFWHFVAERQAIFWRRVEGSPAPWTNDPILCEHRFTNVYRAADRVSQYLIREVIGEGSQEPDELIFRCILFRIFNLPETYTYLRDELGVTPSLRNWSPSHYASLINKRQNAGHNTWSGAYIMRPTAEYFGQGRGAKTTGWLNVLHSMWQHRLFEYIPLEDSLRSAVRALQKFPTVGPFLAMQYATDIGYTSAVHWDEDDYIQPSVGSLRGAQRLFSRKVDDAHLPALATYLIKDLTRNQDIAFAQHKLRFRRIGQTATRYGRGLHLIDMQNCFCEFDKYCRGYYPEEAVGPTRIKQRYSQEAAQRNPAITYTWPERWHIGE